MAVPSTKSWAKVPPGPHLLIELNLLEVRDATAMLGDWIALA